MANNTAFRDAYDLAFQVSPIILNGGSFSNALGGMMPIIGLMTEIVGFGLGATVNGVSIDDFPFRFLPVPGGKIINNAVGNYPFANQQIAANAIIVQPLNISLVMIAPVNTTGGYLTKLPMITALQTALQNHVDNGGTFHIATPGFLYTNCLLTGMTDITGGDTRQQQVTWQLDFVRPLLTQQQASAALSALNQKLAAGGVITTSQAIASAATAVGQPVQGAAANIQGMFGAVNNFLSSSL